MAGKIIVIEGTDGSGKGTQARLLSEKLTRDGFIVEKISFPQYGQASAGPIEEYLNGKYGDADKVSPYAASLLFAVDRFEAIPKIKAIRDSGKIGVFDRYVDSNAGHQGGKISDPGEREKFLAWLYDLEYNILGIPKPDLVIILHVSTDVNLELIGARGEKAHIKEGKKDGHEANEQHLRNAEQSYLWLAKHDPAVHRLIECMDGKRLRSIEEISGLVNSEVSKLGL
ncbi:MAG: deoxynucleoside kinase [bacterium]|nr:deoxynucleoside kinase [bacterium]